MREINKRYLIIAALTLLLATPALAEDMARESIPIDEVRDEVVQDSQQPLQGQQCRAETGSANGDGPAPGLEMLESPQNLMSSPCLGADDGAEFQSVPVCNCVVGQPCIRPCASASQTPQCLDIDCIARDANSNGVCTCVG